MVFIIAIISFVTAHEIDFMRDNKLCYCDDKDIHRIDKDLFSADNRLSYGTKHNQQPVYCLHRRLPILAVM
jgi:hypothetical protein